MKLSRSPVLREPQVEWWVVNVGAIRSYSVEGMAGTTGLEPATSAVTGQRSNQLSYVPRLFFNNLVYVT